MLIGGCALFLKKPLTRWQWPLDTRPRYISLLNIHGGAFDRTIIIQVSHASHSADLRLTAFSSRINSLLFALLHSIDEIMRTIGLAELLTLIRDVSS